MRALILAPALAVLAAAGGGCSGAGTTPAPTLAPDAASITPVAGRAFVDITASAGLVLAEGQAPGEGVALGDADGDGWADIFLPMLGPDRLFRNRGDGTFEDISQAAGLDLALPSEAALFLDLDRDGDEDLVVGSWAGPVLWVNDGAGRFTERTAALIDTEVIIDVADLTAADLDGDGWVDLVLGGYAVEAGGSRAELLATPYSEILRIACLQGPSDFAHRRGGTNCEGSDEGEAPSRVAVLMSRGAEGGFRDVTATLGLSLHAKLQVVSSADVDQDGRPDIFLGYSGNDDQLLRNLGGGRFEDVAKSLGIDRCTAAMGFDFADLDGDGDLDFYVTDNLDVVDKLYAGSGGGFSDVAAARALDSSREVEGWGVLLEDFDNDGWTDVFVGAGWSFVGCGGGGMPSLLFRGLAGGGFERFQAPPDDGLRVAVSSRGVAAADLDHDGDLDVVLANTVASPTVLRNDLAHGHWLDVVLRLAEGGHPPPGVLVTATLPDGRTLRTWSKRGRSYASESEDVVHLGLGAHDRVTRLEVRWPDGAVQSLDAVAVDRRLTIHRAVP